MGAFVLEMQLLYLDSELVPEGEDKLAARAPSQRPGVGDRRVENKPIAAKLEVDSAIGAQFSQPGRGVEGRSQTRERGPGRI